MKLILLLCFVVDVSYASNETDLSDVSKGPHVTHKVWFDIKIDEIPVGKIEIGLFGRTVPITVKNFYDLATNRHGHKGSKFDMIFTGAAIVGGNKDCDSIHGLFFDDENFKLKHYGAGWIAMLNNDLPNTNQCRFIIILIPIPPFDGKYVVFGKVLKGIVYGHIPTKDVVIANCGAEMVDPPFRVARTASTD